MDNYQAEAFHKTHNHQSGKNFLREFIYGGVDGGVTTFAVVAGATGAQFDTSVIIILGLANLVADGFSMSVGSYLSVKAQLEKYRTVMNYEHWGVENIPEMERDEIRTIYRNKGLTGKLLDEVVKVITSNKKIWVEEMMQGEFGMTPEKTSPLSAGMFTFLSFLLIGSIPLIPFLFPQTGELVSIAPFMLTCLLTTLAFVIIGIIKSMVNQTSSFWAVTETVLLGGAAAGIAYYAGYFLESVIVNSL